MKLTPLKNIINLEGKTAIVTGGAMGIGFGIAYRLAEAGAKIVIADLNEDAGNKAAKVLTDDGFKTAFIKTDVANKENVKEATDFAVKTYGSIDILVNNAGIYPIIPVMVPGVDQKVESSPSNTMKAKSFITSLPVSANAVPLGSVLLVMSGINPVGDTGS